jgi:hypothetical protein
MIRDSILAIKCGTHSFSLGFFLFLSPLTGSDVEFQLAIDNEGDESSLYELNCEKIA